LVLIGFRMRIQDHFSISVNLDVGHGQRAGLCPLGHSSLYFAIAMRLILPQRLKGSGVTMVLIQNTRIFVFFCASSVDITAML